MLRLADNAKWVEVWNNCGSLETLIKLHVEDEEKKKKLIYQLNKIRNVVTTVTGLTR